MESLAYEFQEPDDHQEEDIIHHCHVCKKRSSPSNSSSPAPPNPKRPTPPLPRTSSGKYPGFTKLPLPLPPQQQQPPVPVWPPLRRCGSDPVDAYLDPPQSPARVFCRSVSDVAAPSAATAAAAAVMPQGSIGESPDSKRLKRMKERMREMSKWCDQVIADEEDDDDHLVSADEVVNHEAPEGGDCVGGETEAVSVEKNGECLNIHLKCPCSKAYQILLSGNSCYYKLT